MLLGEPPAVDELLLRNELKKRGVNASSEWIRQAVQHVSSTTPDTFSQSAATTPQQQIADKVFSLYLLADFRALAQQPLLPATKDTPHNEWLFGDKPTRPSASGQKDGGLGSGVILQLLHIQDISISSLKTLELCEALGVAGDQPGGFQVGKALPRGMCLLELTDGFRKISAMEMEPIHQVGIEMKLGVKLLIKPVQVRHGMIQLWNSNTQVLGGEVASMNRHPRRLVIMNQMKKNLGIPEDTLPLMPSTPPIDEPTLPQPRNGTTPTTNGSTSNGGTLMFGSGAASRMSSSSSLQRTATTTPGWSTTTPAVGASDSIPANTPRAATLSFKPENTVTTGMSSGMTFRPSDGPSSLRRDPPRHQQQNDWPPATRKRPAEETEDSTLEKELSSRVHQWDADDAWSGIDQEPDWQQFNNDFDPEPLAEPDMFDDTLINESTRRSPSPPTKHYSEQISSPALTKASAKTTTIDQHGKKLDPSFTSTLPSTQRQRLSLKRPNPIARESPPVAKVDEAELVRHVKTELREDEEHEENPCRSPFSSDGDVARDFERRLSVTRDVAENLHGSSSSARALDQDISMHSVKDEMRSTSDRGRTMKRSAATITSTSTSTKVATTAEWASKFGMKSERRRQTSVVDLLSEDESHHPTDRLGADSGDLEDILMEEGLTREEREELARATRESLRLHQEHVAATTAAEAAEAEAIVASTQVPVAAPYGQREEEPMDEDTTMAHSHHHHQHHDSHRVEEFDIRGLDPNAFAGMDYGHHDYLEQHDIPTQVLPQTQAGSSTQDQKQSPPPSRSQQPQQQPSAYPLPFAGQTLHSKSRSHSPMHRPSSSNSNGNGNGNGNSRSSSSSRRTSDRMDDGGLVKIKQERTLFEMDDTEDEDDMALLDASGMNIKKEAIPLVPLNDVLASVEKGLEVRAKARLVRMGKFSLTTLGASLMVFLVPPKQSEESDATEEMDSNQALQSQRLEAQMECGVVEKLLGMTSAEFASLVESNRQSVARESVNSMKQGLMNVELVECRFQGLRKNFPVVREFTILARR